MYRLSAKPEGKKRIIFIGDSVITGYGATIDNQLKAQGAKEGYFMNGIKEGLKGL